MKTMIKEIEQKEKNDQMKVEFGNPKKLKTHLQSAMNTATSLVNYIPKITSELIVCIKDYQKKQILYQNPLLNLDQQDLEVLVPFDL